MPLEPLSIFPMCAFLNSMNKAFTDTVFGSDFSARSFVFSNVSRYFFGYLRKRVRFGMNLWSGVCPTLLCHILHVIIMCSHPKMGGSDTTSVVANMAYKKSHGDGTPVRRERISVGSNAFLVEVEKSIPASIYGANPFPTFRGYIHLFEEILMSVCHSLCMSRPVARDATRFGCLLSPSPRVKRATTVWANQSHRFISFARHTQQYG